MRPLLRPSKWPWLTTLSIGLILYSIDPMGLYSVEIEPEVTEWLGSFSDRDFGRVDQYVGMLAEKAETLSEPWSRNLGDGLRELRFHLHPLEMRITYWLAPGRRVVLLTVFRKTRMRETLEVDRAKVLRKVCEVEHEHARISFDRKVRDMTEHQSMDDIRRERFNRPGFDATEYHAGREEAKLAIELADAIRERRLELGLTQTQLAQRAGLHQPDVSRLESGGGTPTIGMLDRLAHALELRFVARFEKPDAA
ncbi:helix-turn-helix domain-containing protein [Nocardia sp. NBC_00881]|uniref:helix-turn-helix domain-containing protein n=2 Tax=Nocardia TaxID=1817 RepID=UPI003867E744|nr:helix-turn-helix domain-containing protein [Nocardia sp. NBC_00881]